MHMPEHLCRRRRRERRGGNARRAVDQGGEEEEARVKMGRMGKEREMKGRGRGG